MRRAILIIIAIGAVVGVWLWMKRGGRSDKPAEEKAAVEESRVKHDENGRVIINMDDETQGNVGLLVAKPTANHISPEFKGYGRVLDPSPLVAVTRELAAAQAAYLASSNELARLKTLTSQGNASQRALQTAEATALRDQLGVLSAKDRLALSWGKAVAERDDLPAFMQELLSQNAVLVRMDLPAGETLEATPKSARIYTLSGKTAPGQFLGMASTVDPQILGRGSIFLIKPNDLLLLPGEAVTGYLQVPGEPLVGVVIPHDAVVRTEGEGWVYILNPGGASFTRSAVPLDHPIDRGWFVTKGVTTNDYVVVTGAQTLLSEELKPSLKPD